MITQCGNCKRIGLYYHQLLVGFSPDDFVNWARSLCTIDFKTHAHPFPDGEPRIVLKTCHPDIQYILTEEEFDELTEGFAEALLLLEVQELINEQRDK